MDELWCCAFIPGNTVGNQDLGLVVLSPAGQGGGVLEVVGICVRCGDRVHGDLDAQLRVCDRVQLQPAEGVLEEL